MSDTNQIVLPLTHEQAEYLVAELSGIEGRSPDDELNEIRRAIRGKIEIRTNCAVDSESEQ